MIDYDKLPEFGGFTVYDRKTGEPALPQYDNDKVQYVLSQNGNLYEAICAIEGIPKGKYIIQLGNGEWYKW